MILPILEYCSPIWDPYQQRSIHKIEMIQHRAAWFVLNQPWNRHHQDSISEMLQSLKWPSLQTRRKQARLIFLFKILNGLICIPNQCLPSPFPILPPDLATLLNCNSCVQERIFIITHFCLEQFLIGTIYVLTILMSWISFNFFYLLISRTHQG